MNATMLVIWPDIHDGDVMKRMLPHVFSMPSYRLIHMESIREAIESVSATKHDIIMTLRSVEVPDDGINFCRSIRHHSTPDRRAIPVIIGWIDVGSANTYYEATQQCTRAGANGCFGRVFDVSGIKQMVDILLVDPTRSHLHDQPVAYQQARHG